ncbi:hypothetical protein NE237_015170 [Protea cynaroides]|uniref:Synergin gamma C-terminal domain-containing protein n=1 Tax=Protea cynaroides TaxID=273540 RepID=A0A9Q0KDN9_9MAGN|nr:hypothetical protein NE237_015170 [Protea cynaroides]
MAEIQADDDDDEGFGDFKFVSASSNGSKSMYHGNGVEDDWGDFMDNFSPKQDFFGNPPVFFTQTLNPTNPPQTLQSLDLFGDFSDHSTKTTDSKLNHLDFSDHSTKATDSKLNHVESVKDSDTPVAKKRWEKLQGALPLSIFGEEEEESDLNNPSFNDTADVFSAKKLSSPVKNDVKFGAGLPLNDLIVNLYTQADPINNQNGSNSNLVDGDEIFDDESWQFKDAFSQDKVAQDKVGDRDSAVEVEVTASPSGIQVETTTGTSTDQKLQVNGKRFEHSEGASNNSGLSSGGPDYGDIFAASDWLPHTSEGFDNGFSFVTNIATQNGSISGPFSHAKQNTTENGSNSKSGDANIDTDDDFWDFKDAFSETEDVNFSSGIKEEQTGTGFSGADVKVLAFDSEVHGNGRGLTDHQEPLSPSFFSDGKLDADDTLFGVDVSSHKPANYVRNSTFGPGLDQNVSLTDLIFTLYSQAEGTPAVNSTKKSTGDEFSSAKVSVTSDLVNGEDDFNGNSWEFKDAFSETKVDEEFSSILVGVGSVNSTGKPTEAQVGLNSDIVNGEDGFDGNSWEFRDAFSEIKPEGQSYVLNLSDTDQRFLSESKVKNVVDFYSRLMEESCIVALHHLDRLKKSQKVAAISGEDVKAMALHEEIQEAYKKLHKEDVISEDVYPEKLSTRNVCVDEFMNDPKFQVLDSEYELSKRISLAENDLTSAIELFEHAILILKILSVGSVEEQSKYITTWFKMISACAQELKHGAFIWKQSLLKTIHKRILSEPQGQKYFLALAEIYRVVEVLRASAILYKPWILSNLVDPSVIFILLEECMAVWSGSGLEEAVQSIPDPVVVGYGGTIKALLESIKFIHDLDAVALQNQVFSLEEPVCQLSRLSHAVVPDMKVVVWDGGHYFLTLANLWANRISCDPPKTSRLRVSDDDRQS